MDSQTILALTAYGVVASFTPGPNNLMLMASGANFGMTRSMAHVMGVVVGFSVMIVIVGLGLAGLFHTWPPAYTVLTVISVAYTLWLAWKIARSGAPETGTSRASPMSLLQAAAFQWVNPKAWTMALSTITIFAPDQQVQSILLIAGVYALLSFASTMTWAAMGLSIRGWLSSQRRLLIFNYGMAALLVGSLVLAL